MPHNWRHFVSFFSLPRVVWRLAVAARLILILRMISKYSHADKTSFLAWVTSDTAQVTADSQGKVGLPPSWGGRSCTCVKKSDRVPR